MKPNQTVFSLTRTLVIVGAIAMLASATTHPPEAPTPAPSPTPGHPSQPLPNPPLHPAEHEMELTVS